MTTHNAARLLFDRVPHNAIRFGRVRPGAVRFVPLTEEHLAALCPAQPFLHLLAVPDLAWAAIVRGQPIGAGGVFPETGWYGYAWLIMAPAVRPTGRSWHAIAAKAVEVIAAAHCRGLHRVWTRVDPASRPACRLAWRLGFEQEGIERAHFPDRRDAVMVSHIAPAAS